MIAPLPVLQSDAFEEAIAGPLIAAPEITTLQLNIGLVCNLACRHCHVESGPRRLADDENLSSDTAERILAWVGQNESVRTVDITGGSPELNPSFRHLVRSIRQLGRHVMDRCNPTVISAPHPRTAESMEWIPEFLAEHRVEVVASMPCYLGENVEHQRGRGAYDSSISGLRALNRVGYGVDPDLPLNLVYNPGGAHLPPPQESLTDDYRRELGERYGIVFNELWTLTNMRSSDGALISKGAVHSSPTWIYSSAPSIRRRSRDSCARTRSTVTPPGLSTIATSTTPWTYRLPLPWEPSCGRRVSRSWLHDESPQATTVTGARRVRAAAAAALCCSGAATVL